MSQTNCAKCHVYICDCICPDVTGYSKKRRLLREHRKTMRVMQRVIYDNNLSVAYFHELNAEPGAPQDWDVFWSVSDVEELGYQHPDESSDVEDPEKRAKDDLEEYKREVADKETLFQIAVVETARKSVEDRQVQLDLERARMQFEDLRGAVMRSIRS